MTITKDEAFNYLLDKLDTTEVRGNHAMAHCPAHEDHDPSLSITCGDGKALVKCMAGCDTQDVLAQLGLGWEALFDEPPHTAQLMCTYRYQRPDGAVWMTVERWLGRNTKTGTFRKTFKQRGSNGTDMKDTKPCLYNLPEVIPAARDGQEIWITEGEKDVHALKTQQVVATTAPMGAGKWQPYYWRWLDGASRIVVVADDDPEGRKSAARVCADLRSHGFIVETVLPHDGCKDAFDHIAAGHPVSEFRPVNLNRLRPHGVNHHALMHTLYPPVSWAVPNLLPAGLAILGGTVKIGKSWLALDIGLNVARGLNCLGGFRCANGPVLYLALDNDSERRLQERVRHISLLDDDAPIEFHTTWPTGPDAIAAVQEWITEVARPRLVVIDTLVRVEPDFDKGDGAYSCSTEALTRWARLAIDNDLSVLAVHHDRKSFGDTTKQDWVDRFSGSRGLTASAATLMFLDAERGHPDGTLHVTGRDVTCQDLPLTMVGGIWHATGLLDQTHLTPPPPVPAGMLDVQIPPLPDDVPDNVRTLIPRSDI